jgi:hypothetical protein
MPQLQATLNFLNLFLDPVITLPVLGQRKKMTQFIDTSLSETSQPAEYAKTSP